MKTLRTLFAALAIMMMSIAASAQPMSVYSMRNNARFLTDRMAYTLGLSAAILDDLYYINYDYICGVNDFLDAVALGYRYDDYMEVIYARDRALRRLLTLRQWELLMTYDYFYRPISFVDHRWHFSIYQHDRRMDRFYYRQPRLFDDYRGGRFFTGMRRIDGPGMPPPGGAPMGGIAQPNGGGPGYHIGEPTTIQQNRGDIRTESIRQGGTMNSTIRQGATATPGNTATQTTAPATSYTRTAATANTGNTRTTTTQQTGTTRTTTVPTTNNSRTITSPTTSSTRTTATAGRTTSSSTRTVTAPTTAATRSAGASSTTATRSAGTSSSSATRSAGAASTTATRSAGRR